LETRHYAINCDAGNKKGKKRRQEKVGGRMAWGRNVKNWKRGHRKGKKRIENSAPICVDHKLGEEATTTEKRNE
jgi:hypothetical protein